MKKIIFALFVTGVLFASCVDKKGYTIKGTLTGKAETPDSVMVNLYEEGKWDVSLDSAMVIGGKFEFKGIQPTPVIRFVATLVGGKQPAAFPIVLEAGEITLEVDEQAVVSGTPLNNAMQDFNSMKNEKYKEMGDLYEKTQGLAEGDAQNTEIKASLDAISKSLAQSTKAMIKQNMDNPLGYFYFTSNVFSLEKVSDMKEVLDLVPDSLKREPRMIKIASTIEAKNATDIGKKFTDIKGLTIDGKEASLSDYAGKGKVVLLDFWASWCGPCIHELPNVKKAYDAYKNKGFEIVGVSLDGKHDAWKNATDQHEIKWPQFSNLKAWNEDGAKAYGVMGIPHTVLIDKDGTIIYKDLRGDGLANKIGELLGK